MAFQYQNAVSSGYVYAIYRSNEYMINMIDNLYLALINTPEHCCTH